MNFRVRELYCKKLFLKVQVFSSCVNPVDINSLQVVWKKNKHTKNLLRTHTFLYTLHFNTEINYAEERFMLVKFMTMISTACLKINKCIK